MVKNKNSFEDDLKQISEDMNQWRSDIIKATDSFNFCSRRLDRLLRKLEENKAPLEEK